MKKLLIISLMICLTIISIGCTKTKYITKTKVLIPPLPKEPTFEKVEGERARHNGEWGIFYKIKNYKKLQKNLEKLNLYIDQVKSNHKEYKKMKERLEGGNARKKMPKRREAWIQMGR